MWSLCGNGFRADYSSHEKSVRYCLITEDVVRRNCAAHYFSRGQKVAFLEAVERERLS